MDDDMCDLDAIEALLEEESENDELPHNLEPATADLKNITTQKDTPTNDCASSDDEEDIDDDELDKLASLVEADNIEQEATANASQQVQEAPRNPAKYSITVEEETELKKVPSIPDKQSIKPESVSPKVVQGLTPSPSSTACVPASTNSEATVMLKLSELSAMEEQIKLMKAQLLEQAKQISPESTQASSSVRTQPEATKSDPSKERSKSSHDDEKPVKVPKMRLLEKDIFGTIDSSPETTPVKKKSPPQRKPIVKTTPNHKQPPHDKTAAEARPVGKLKTPKSKTKLTTEENDIIKAFKAEDSGSDWEGMDGEQPASLTNQGKDIKKMLHNGTKQRIAHVPKNDVAEHEPKKKPYNSTWRQKPETTTSSAPFSRSSSASSQPSSSYQNLSDKDTLRELYSGINIINPLVSSESMKTLMTGRKMIRLSRLHTKVKSSELDADWVTVGVVVNKSEARKSAKGNQYSIWRLSDLDDCDKVVSFFLFKNVYQELWKTATNSVVGILNPSIMQGTEKSSSQEVSITIDNPKKMLVLGRSRDIARCKSKTKAGNDCINFVNREKGDYCTYHVQAAYKKTSSKRSELQSGSSGGGTPRSFEKKLFNKGSSVMYAGQTFTTASLGNAGTKTKKNTVSIKSLQGHHIRKDASEKVKISTLQLHDILPDDKVVLDNIKQQKKDKNEKFHEALCVPTVGSLNYVKHMMISEKLKEKENAKVTNNMQSITAKDLLRLQQKELENKRESQKKRLGVSGPSLGKGLAPDADVVFDFDEAPLMPAIPTSAAKRKAIAKIQNKGGLKKEDPNASNKSKSPNKQDRVKRRLNDSTQESNSDEQEDKPPKKRSRILGDVDLDSPDIQRLLKAKSKHDGMLNEQEQEKQDQYFEVLEKKEKMEQKMSSITVVKCKAFVCKQCKYRAMSMAPRCKEERHNVVVSDAVKKFFECKDCKLRTVTIERYPQHSCQKCGGGAFLHCAMFKEKKGPKLASEELSLRGDEIKNLNSLIN